jgi:hypothetical protein
VLISYNYTQKTLMAIRNERNARVFHNKQAPMVAMLEKMRKEAKHWVTVGVKKLSEFLPGD